MSAFTERIFANHSLILGEALQQDYEDIGPVTYYCVDERQELAGGRLLVSDYKRQLSGKPPQKRIR